MKSSKYKVEESFGDFIKGTEVIQTSNSIPPAQFGANPGEQEELPFNFERSPEVGSSNNMTMTLEKIQAIADAAISKANKLSRTGDISNAYIENQLNKAYTHLREGYLRLMDIR